MNVQDGEPITVIHYSSKQRLMLTQIGLFPRGAMALDHGDVLDGNNDALKDLEQFLDCVALRSLSI